MLMANIFNFMPNDLVEVIMVSQKQNAINKSIQNDKVFIVQELCENRGGCPGLSGLTSLLVSVDVKIY